MHGSEAARRMTAAMAETEKIGSTSLSGRITISPKNCKSCCRDQMSLLGRASDTYIMAHGVSKRLDWGAKQRQGAGEGILLGEPQFKGR
jgi:hypothetical protein